MALEKKFCLKFAIFILLASFNFVLLFISLNINYQLEVAKEHVRFRSGFPSQVNWIPSPDGRLKCYLFNVTNSEEFLNGTDSKMKLKQVGPITYSIRGYNKIIEQTQTTLTYEKIRYHSTKFEPLESVSPDILNKTIILPNFVLLSSAAKLHDWLAPVRTMFNLLTINQKVFLKDTIYYFLWDFQVPALNILSSYMPNIVSNCGILYNALRGKEEIFKVKIGTTEEFTNFFKVITLNNRTTFKEHKDKQMILQTKSLECPIEISNTYDNSLFPPFLKTDDIIDIVAGESCRTLRMKFSKKVKHGSFWGYRYTLGDKSDAPNCLATSVGVKLHKGMFDVSKCLINDVPAAFSAPHFFGSKYNWSEHYEGFEPIAEEHEAYIILEPITGVPIEEKYRFQSNIPLPDFSGYSDELQKFSNIVVPSFWYEYEQYH